MFTDTRSVQVRQPVPHDLVGRRFTIAGVGHGFEGTVGWHVLDEDNNIVVEGGVQGGGMVVMDNFGIDVDLGDYSGGSQLVVEVFGDNPADDEGEKPGFDTNRIPVVFGPAILDDYTGFRLQQVQPGDTLSGIAAGQQYGTTTTDAVFAANKDQLDDPDRIQPGQILRIPLVG
ncbi:Gmad2 immunoglobulin-like domain-containing protein [Euzebya sp.]|uniref:LysM peptidoglycan-binding domain-containing protein n=1 Tax=Euzebya sp. TaxID=1971409 RepID=UPI0035156228